MFNQYFLLEINLGIILFFSFYKAITLSNTNFKINRFYLIAGIFISIIISLPVFQSTLNNNTLSANIFLSPILVKTDNINYSLVATHYADFSFIKLIYITGFVFFTFVLFVKIYNLLKLYYSGQIIKYNNYTVVNINKDISPFSFFHIIFINKSGLNKNDTERIITHELIHINQKHSIDILIIEWLCIFLWFNPFIWMYKNAIKENHEYIADESVLRSGVSFDTYKQLIMSQIFGISVPTISNNFVKSLTKKRFKMMTKKKNTKRVNLKTILILPIAITIFFLLVFSINSCKNSNGTHNVISQKDSIYSTVDKMPVFIGGAAKLQQFIAENIIYPELAKKLNVEGKVYVQFVVDEKGKVTNTEVVKSTSDRMEKIIGAPENPSKYDAVKMIDAEALRVIKKLPVWQPGKNNGKTVKVKYTVPINFKLN